MTSVLNVDTIADKAGTGPVGLTKQSAAKAWVNFNGQATIAARDSFNLSSLTDNGAGDYRVNFTNAFGANNYFVGFSATVYNIAYPRNCGITATSDIASSSVRFIDGYTSSFGTGAAEDPDYAGILVHGDLA